MTRISELPEISVLADDDFVTAIDVSDMSESPTGKNVKIQKQNLVPAAPLVQSAQFNSDGTLAWSSESGWSCVEDSTGNYTVTFPTAVASSAEQSVALNHIMDSATNRQSEIRSLTTTTMQVKTRTLDSATAVALAFTVIRVTTP